MGIATEQVPTLSGGEAPEPDGFVCRQCGECCRGVGGILVTPAEMEALAAYLGLEVAVLKRDYLVDTPLGWQVASPGGACIFLAGGLCRVHPVKPRICRQWPYLPALLGHAEEFEAAKEACPGLAAVGSHEDFRRQAKIRGGDS
ncbi:MAG: YkgJ family cysteine cluster protein [Desulfobaccales bacterium]